jgi:predicted GNAT family acetyltransferase
MASNKIVHDQAQKVFYLQKPDTAIEASSRVYYTELGAKSWDFDHTVTPKAQQGQGLARKVVTAAFEYCDEHGVDYSRSTCTYVVKLLNEKKSKV